MNPLRRAALKKLGLAAAAPVAMPGAVMRTVAQGVPGMIPGSLGLASPKPAWERLGIPKVVWRALAEEYERESERMSAVRMALLGVVDADIQEMLSLSSTAKARMQTARSMERSATSNARRRGVFGDPYDD